MQFTALTEQPVVAVGFGLTVLLFVGDLAALGYWARKEAAARDRSVVRTLWYLLTGVGAVHYAFVRFIRRDPGSRDAPPGPRERLAAAYTVAVVLAFLAGAVVSPPDPVTQVLAFPPLFAVAFAAMALLVTREPLAGESNAPT